AFAAEQLDEEDCRAEASRQRGKLPDHAANAALERCWRLANLGHQCADLTIASPRPGGGHLHDAAPGEQGGAVPDLGVGRLTRCALRGRLRLAGERRLVDEE